MEPTRTAVRTGIALAVECELGAERRLARTVDLSVRGMCLEMADPVGVGSLFRVGFDLPSGRGHVEVEVLAIWAQPAAGKSRVGFRFERFLQGYIELGDFLLKPALDS
jgi:PilZ domain-containing protein